MRDVYRIRITKVYASCVQGGLLRGYKSIPVKHKHMQFPPACSSPLITEDLLGSSGWASTWECTAPKKTVCTVPQSFQYHYSFHLKACYGLPGYIVCWVDSLCTKLFWCWPHDQLIAYLHHHSPNCRSPGIDSKESIPPAYVAWRAGTMTLLPFGS